MREKGGKKKTPKAEHTAFLFFRNTVFHAHLRALLPCAKDITYLLAQCPGLRGFAWATAVVNERASAGFQSCRTHLLAP